MDISRRVFAMTGSWSASRLKKPTRSWPAMASPNSAAPNGAGPGSRSMSSMMTGSCATGSSPACGLRVPCRRNSESRALLRQPFVQKFLENRGIAVLGVFGGENQRHRACARLVEQRSPRALIRGQFGQIFFAELRPFRLIVVITAEKRIAHRQIPSPSVNGEIGLALSARPEPVNEIARAILSRYRVVCALDLDRHGLPPL